MPVKKGDAKSTASNKLLDINSQLHVYMANILNEMKQEEGIAVIPSAPVKEAAAAGNSALKVLKSVSPSAAEIPVIEATTNAIHNVMDIIPEENGQLTVPADAAEDLVNKIINVLANQVHDAAVHLINITGSVGGCKVSQIIPEEAAAVSSYCSGVLASISQATVHKGKPEKMEIKGQQVYIQYPQQIQHSLGVHYAKVSPKSLDGNANFSIEYHDSVHFPHSKQRWQGVLERLEAEGFSCQPAAPGTNIYCTGEVPKSKLRQMATYFSLLLNADLGHYWPSGTPSKDIVAVIRDKVWDKAGELDKKYSDQTWSSPQGQMNFAAALEQWKEEEQLKKSAVYTDLRNLAIIRNKHHEVEEKYGIPNGKASIPGAKLVAENAQEALTIANKNGWSTHGLGHPVATLNSMVKSGTVGNIASLSDGIGHIIHIILTHQLGNIGTYGGCPMSGDIDNINAGNLAYCEGVLKGTTVKISKGGNYFQHNVGPGTYKTFTLNEDPAGGHHVTFWIPEPAEWGQTLAKFLQEHNNFECSGNQCKAYIKSLDDIRELALFLSNLKGVGPNIGTECTAKALELALSTAKDFNKKGVFAFTLEPIFDKDKAWIKLCHDKYGILPPGLTEEEKQIISTVGPDKTYGGCSFADSEELPGKGEMIYCEGVRQNPQATISAYMDDNGNLHHFFHGNVDQIAQVSINPTGPNTFQLTLSDMDFRGAELQKEMVKRLKKLGLSCPTGNNCSGEVNAQALRKLAAFISSVHQIYKLPEWCVEPAVSYAYNQVSMLPDDVGAHDSKVYPWITDQWNNEVCSKVSVPAPSAKPAAAKAKPKKTIPDWEAPLENFKDSYGVTWKFPKAQVVKLISEGFSKQDILEFLSVAKYSSTLGFSHIPLKIALQITELYFGEEAPKPPPIPTKEELEANIKKSQEQSHQLYDKLTTAEKKKMQETEEYKKLPKSVKDWLHAVMNLYLLEDFKAGIPYEETLKKTQENTIHSDVEPIPITPLMVKLQLEIEKKKKIRKGELPAEAGEKVAKTYEGLSQDEQSDVKDAISEQIESGKNIKETIDYVKDYYALIETNALIDQVTHEWEVHQGEQGPSFEELKEPSLVGLAQAIEAIKKGQPFAGCHPDHPGVSLSEPQATYCQGILTPPGQKKAGFVQFAEDTTTGKEIPIVSQFGDGYNATATSPTPDTLSIAFKEVDAKGAQWKQRQEIVVKLLDNMDYACSFLDDHFVCTRSGLNMAEEGDQALARTTALFLSKLHGIDELPYTCVNRAVRFALSQAHGNEEKLKEQAYKQNIYPYTLDEWNKEVCEKVTFKEVKEKAQAKAKELGTVKLLELAHQHNINPTGSDAALAQKIIEAGIIDP